MSLSLPACPLSGGYAGRLFCCELDHQFGTDSCRSTGGSCSKNASPDTWLRFVRIVATGKSRVGSLLVSISEFAKSPNAWGRRLKAAPVTVLGFTELFFGPRGRRYQSETFLSEEKFWMVGSRWKRKATASAGESFELLEMIVLK